jgi:lysophospholipase L1-like esterase
VSSTGFRLRPLAERAALVLGSTVLMVAALEGALRLGWSPPMDVSTGRIANTKGLDVRPGTTELVCYPSNPRGYFDIDLRDEATRARYLALGMRNMDRVVPGLPFAVESRFNAQGFRDADFVARRPGLRRVAVVGDSFTEGWGVKEADCFPRVLERALNREEPGRWQVLNFGKSNADFPRLLFNLKTALDWQPDVVVYAMVLNDPEKSPRIQSRVPHARNNLLGPTSTAPASRLRLVDLLRLRLAQRATKEATIDWYLSLFTDENPRWADTKHEIRTMDRLVRERGGSFVIALWPMLLGLERDYPLAPAHQTIAAFAQKSHIRFVDLLEALAGQPSAELCVHPIDMHPNERAQRLVGEHLVGVVRPLGPVSSFHEVSLR